MSWRPRKSAVGTTEKRFVGQILGRLKKQRTTAKTTKSLNEGKKVEGNLMFCVLLLLLGKTKANANLTEGERKRNAALLSLYIYIHTRSMCVNVAHASGRVTDYLVKQS